MPLLEHRPKPNTEKKTPKAVQVLALDLATKTGWAITKDIYGLWDFSLKKDESSGMKLIRLRSKLRECLEEHKVGLVVFERVAGRFKNDITHQSKLQAIVETELLDRGIDYRAYSAKEIKVFATGKGNAGKPDMVKAAQLKYSYTGNNDNEADALHLLHLALADYKGSI
jgi:Holliday junction resolvasome RuvABC endonuclease subunit